MNFCKRRTQKMCLSFFRGPTTKVQSIPLALRGSCHSFDHSFNASKGSQIEKPVLDFYYLLYCGIELTLMGGANLRP